MNDFLRLVAEAGPIVVLLIVLVNLWVRIQALEAAAKQHRCSESESAHFRLQRECSEYHSRTLDHIMWCVNHINELWQAHGRHIERSADHRQTLHRRINDVEDRLTTQLVQAVKGEMDNRRALLSPRRLVAHWWWEWRHRGRQA